MPAANHPAEPGVQNHKEITPTDGLIFATTDAICVNVSGNVSLRFENASADTTVYLLQGVWYRARVIKVNATNTTATGIKGLYY